MRCNSLFLIVSLILASGSLRAQVVRGDVMDSTTHTPVFGATVIAVDSVGERVAGAFSNDSGQFALRLPGSGHFALHVERIGYASPAPANIVAGPGETVSAHLVASSVAIALPTVTVNAESKCAVRPTTGAQTAVLWEEARKALYATQLAYNERLVYVVRKRYWRRLDGSSLSVRHDSSRVDSVLVERPWKTPATPEDLAAYGYGVLDEVGDSALAGPDADVLLSDAFARTHCFDLRVDAEKHAGLLGLGFAPALRRSVPDVTGVLWIDSASARLRYVDFRHTGMFPEVSPLRYGGRIEFEQLPGGIWIVRRWHIRLPVVATGSMSEAGVGDMRYFGGGRHVAFYHDEGGEVLVATVVAVPPDSASRPPHGTP